MNDGNDKHEGAWWGNLETLKPSQVQSDYSYVDEDDRRKKFIIIVMLLILFAIIMVGIPQAYDFYTQDPLGIPVLIVVVLFAATGSVIIYKMADIDVE